MDIIDLIKRIDFGDIDGLYDPQLSRYFLDDDYWGKIVDGDVFLYWDGRARANRQCISG